jgi:pilus assembly protein CpaB
MIAVKQRSGGITFLVLSVIAGLAAAILAVQFLRSAARTVTVLVAAKEIPAFTELVPNMFTARQVPVSAVPSDAMTSPSALNGRFNRSLLLEGEVMRQGDLAQATTEGGWLSAKLTETGVPGTRAFSVTVDNTTGVGGTVEVGDKVDVVATVKLEQANGSGTIFAKVIAAGAPVLHKTAADSSGKYSVILQVTPSQAEAIAFAQMTGNLSLATNPLRSDTASQSTPGMTPDRFLDRYGGR